MRREVLETGVGGQLVELGGVHLLRQNAGAVNVIYGHRGGLREDRDQLWTQGTRGIRAPSATTASAARAAVARRGTDAPGRRARSSDE